MIALKNKLEKLICDKHKLPLNYFNIFQDKIIQQRVFCLKCEKPKNSINVDQLFEAFQQLIQNNNHDRLQILCEEFNSQLNILQLMIKQLQEDFQSLIQLKSKNTLMKEFDELINDPQLSKIGLNKIIQNISQFTIGQIQEKYIFIQEEVSDQRFAILQELCQRLSEITEFSQKYSLIKAPNDLKQPNNNQTNENLYQLHNQIQSNFKSIHSMQFNYDSTKLLIKGDDKQINLEVWGQKGNVFQKQKSLICHQLGILHFCVSLQSDVYFTAGIDDKSNDFLKPYTYSIKIWSPKIQQEAYSIIHQTHHHIGCIVLSKQEQYLAIGDGYYLKIFRKANETSYQSILTSHQQKQFVKCLAFDKLDQMICCGTENSDILMYKLEEQKLSLIQKISAGYIPKQLIFTNEYSLLSLNRDGIVQVFQNDAKQLDFRCVQVISENNIKIRSMAINSNQSEIVLGWENNQFEFMKLTQGKWEMKSRHPQQFYVKFLSFSPIQSVLAVTNESKIMIYQQQC